MNFDERLFSRLLNVDASNHSPYSFSDDIRATALEGEKYSSELRSKMREVANSLEMGYIDTNDAIENLKGIWSAYRAVS